VDHGVAVLQRRLEHALRRDRGRPDVAHELQQPVRLGAREAGEEQVRGELQVHGDLARPGHPHRVGQRARLPHADGAVVERQPRRALERDRAGARAGADQHRHPLAQVRGGRGGERLRRIGGADEDHELGALERRARVAARVPDRREALQVAVRGDPARRVDRDDVLGVVRRREQRDLVAVLREVERRRHASVARSQHRHAHGPAP
jgi:hypothetical protein